MKKRITALAFLVICGAAIAKQEPKNDPKPAVLDLGFDDSNPDDRPKVINTGDGHCYVRTRKTVEQESKGGIERPDKVIVIKPIECR